MGNTNSKGEQIETMDTMIQEHNALSRYNTQRKRLTVSEENAKDDLIEKVTVIPSHMDENTERWLLEIFQSHYLFCSLGDVELIQVVRKMVKCTANAEDYIFKMGERPGAFFII